MTREEKNAPVSLVRLYLREAGKAPLLSRAEEVEKAQAMECAKVALFKIAEMLLPEEREAVCVNGSRIPEDPDSWRFEAVSNFAERIASAEAPVRKEIAEAAETCFGNLCRARDEFICANLRLVVCVAKAYRGGPLPLSDLIQEGNIGLCVAVDRFNLRRGTKFSTYASWWIRQKILSALGSKGRMIRVPLNKHQLLIRIGHAYSRLSHELSRKPTFGETAERVGITEEETRELVQVAAEPYPLDDPLPGGEGGGGTFAGYVRVKSANPEEAVERSDLIRAAESLLARAKLSPRELGVIRLRYGLAGGREHTHEEIGRRYRLSRQRIRQIQEDAIGKVIRSVRVRRGLSLR
ncbi:MAG: sigma-70 family RNA polymerase sigma factor [Candidatus Liptonbacteria bacterium]|nr:sigma-70 family RNA polymerase sigma factor [Candidatus Liptonbacteria bacterium]